ncbi:hypothetical protein SAMN05444388_11670 [Flavobacterium johnsoniae]|uniref:Uncharacterized protein n=1 Tax=Flavobacterium johnsoniae TaxID=986 RepID=A0A1M5VA84_FLAJO|nr:hypothetical protein SAMN05444388_11670 [Flavobacterium johnsoniae]
MIINSNLYYCIYNLVQIAAFYETLVLILT